MESANEVVLERTKKDSVGDLPKSLIVDMEKLNKRATAKLIHVCKEFSDTGLKGTGFEYAEVIAAKELLDGSVRGLVR